MREAGPGLGRAGKEARGGRNAGGVPCAQRYPGGRGGGPGVCNVEIEDELGGDCGFAGSEGSGGLQGVNGEAAAERRRQGRHVNDVLVLRAGW